MDTSSWEKYAVCPICKNKFRIGRLVRHLNHHKGITREQEDLIRNAAIDSASKSMMEERNSAISASIGIKNNGAIDVMTHRKQHYYASQPLSGGAFGQGKKK